MALANLEVLLHLGALGVGIPVGYIGLDRIREERDKLKEEINKVREEMQQLFLKLDIKQSDKRKLKVVFNNYKAYVLCYVAEDSITIGWRRVFHIVHRQCYVPGLAYFRHRSDLKVVSFIAALLTICFIIFTGAATWDWETLQNSPYPEIYYIVLIASLAWIFLTVTCSYRIRKIRIICAELFDAVSNDGKRIMDDALKSFPGGDPRDPHEAKP